MAVKGYVRHDGLLGATFADGAIGSGYANGQVLVVRVGEHDLPPDKFYGRADTEVTGWMMVCSCGWRGTHWLRAASPAEQDLDRRLVYSAHPSPPMDAIDAATSAEYHEHITPIRDAVLAELTALTGEPVHDEERLRALVGRSRELGADWADVAGSTGLTPQAAHERWRDAPKEILTGWHWAQLDALGRLAGPEWSAGGDG